MDEYPKLILKVTDMITPTKVQKKLLDLLNDNDVRRGVNQIIADRTEKYVPMESGALRESVKVGPKTISWGSGLDYARYQYGGVIYRVNRPITVGGTIIGWRSPAGVKKQPATGEHTELGVPGEWKGWPFGYKTPGTKHHWIDEMLSHEKRSMQQQITRYLKAEAKKRNK